MLCFRLIFLPYYQISMESFSYSKHIFSLGRGKDKLVENQRSCGMVHAHFGLHVLTICGSSCLLTLIANKVRKSEKAQFTSVPNVPKSIDL